MASNTRETVCDDCELVIDERRLDHRPEWRDCGDADSNPERTGDPLTPARPTVASQATYERYSAYFSSIVADQSEPNVSDQIRNQARQLAEESEATNNSGEVKTSQIE